MLEAGGQPTARLNRDVAGSPLRDPGTGDRLFSVQPPQSVPRRKRGLGNDLALPVGERDRTAVLRAWAVLRDMHGQCFQYETTDV